LSQRFSRWTIISPCCISEYNMVVKASHSVSWSPIICKDKMVSSCS
jgi:hypothetical protein